MRLTISLAAALAVSSTALAQAEIFDVDCAGDERSTAGQSGANNCTSDPIRILTGGYNGVFSILSFSPCDNKLTNVTGTTQAGAGPSWATWDQDNPNQIWVTNDGASKDSNGLTYFKWSESSKKLLLQDQGTSGLAGTVSVRRSRLSGSRCLFAAGYGAKAVSSQRLNATGSLITGSNRGSTDYAPTIVSFDGSGPNKERQDQSRPHQVIDSPDGSFVYSPDLGADVIHVLAYDGDKSDCKLKKLPKVKTNAGDGPRHMTFVQGSNATFAYVVTELGGTIRSYSVDTKTGKLTLLNSPSAALSTRKGIETGPIHEALIAPSEAMVTPDGKHVYVANRHLPRSKYDQDLIAHFSRDVNTGVLTGPLAQFSSGGRNPRHASMSADGNYIVVANQAEDDDPTKGAGIAVLKRDVETGSLKVVETWANVTGAAYAAWWPGTQL